MKAYNTPNDTLTIKSDEGEELVKITPDKTTIANLDGGDRPTSTAAEIDATVNILKKFIGVENDKAYTLYGKNGQIYESGIEGILGDANHRDVLASYSPLNTLEGRDGIGNAQHLIVALQPYYSSSNYYFRRLGNGTFDQQMPIVTDCRLNKSTSSEDSGAFSACFARPYSISLSQVEGGTLFTTGALDILMTDDEIESCPLKSNEVVSKVYVEGLALNSFVNNTWNGVVYADVLSGMGITKPVFVTCALTSTGIHLTAVPFT